MARNGFLYYGAWPSVADEVPNVEVTNRWVLLRFAGSGCAELQFLIHPRIKDAAQACCAPPSAPELWATWRRNGCKTVLCGRHNQIVLAEPGNYRVQVCHGDLDTVVYWTETDIPIATAPSPHIAQGGP